MVAVFMLFLLPVGGGIPAGVLLAHTKGLAWPLTAGLYLVSDVVLAMAFEPLLRLFVRLGRRIAFLARFGAAMKASMARTAALWRGRSGPVTQVLIAFLVDPMTGRSTALAAGYGPLAGWSMAILGDMLYYGVIAAATLKLNAWLRNPTLTMGVVAAIMVGLPMLLRRRSVPGRAVNS